MNILGVSVSDLYFLNYPDGKLQDLSESDRQNLVTQLQQLIKHYEAEEIYVSHAKDGHQDHEAACQLAHTATAAVSSEITLFQYPIWLFWEHPFLSQLKRQDFVGNAALALEVVASHSLVSWINFALVLLAQSTSSSRSISSLPQTFSIIDLQL